MRLSLRSALEGVTEGDANGDGQPDSVVMTGPLAEVYRNALNIAYAKPDPITGKPAVATESQAIDAMVARAVAEAVAKNTEGPDNLTIYGVSKVEANDEDVVAVAKQLATSEKPDEFVLVVDATVPGANGAVGGESQYMDSVATLESLVKQYGGKVFASLEELYEDLTGEEYKPASPTTGQEDNPDLPPGEIEPSRNDDPAAQTPQDKD